MNNIPYLLALHFIDGLGPIRLRAVLDYFKDPKLAWEASAGQIRQIGVPQSVAELLAETRKKLDPETYADEIRKNKIKWISVFDDNYPKLLAQIYDPPIVLYYKGETDWNNSCIAVVGTRKITGYGKVVTEKFTSRLVDAGLIIVSGLARGVDGVAHRSAVLAGGKTIAVLGGGLKMQSDDCKIFPPENQSLAEEIINGHGALISEFPPDSPSLPGNFPSRNRIISGLSLATLVTEAASDSGSLITARLAVEQGRDVFAVPGPITSDLSRGPIELIKEGAKIVYDPQEILDEMGMGTVQSSKFKVQSKNNLTEDEKKILECLQNESLHIDELGRLLSFPSPKISAMLLKMEISGLVQNLGGGLYTRI